MQHMPLHQTDEQALRKLSDQMVNQDPSFKGFEPVSKVYARYYLFIWEIKDLGTGEIKYLATSATPRSRFRFDLSPWTMDPHNSRKVLYDEEDLDTLIEKFNELELGRI